MSLSAGDRGLVHLPQRAGELSERRLRDVAAQLLDELLEGLARAGVVPVVVLQRLRCGPRRRGAGCRAARGAVAPELLVVGEIQGGALQRPRSPPGARSTSCKGPSRPMRSSSRRRAASTRRRSSPGRRRCRAPGQPAAQQVAAAPRRVDSRRALVAIASSTSSGESRSAGTGPGSRSTARSGCRAALRPPRTGSGARAQVVAVDAAAAGAGLRGRTRSRRRRCRRLLLDVEGRQQPAEARHVAELAQQVGGGEQVAGLDRRGPGRTAHERTGRRRAVRRRKTSSTERRRSRRSRISASRPSSKVSNSTLPRPAVSTAGRSAGRATAIDSPARSARRAAEAGERLVVARARSARRRRSAG